MGGDKIEKLTDTNYADWKVFMTMLLKEDKLWKFVLTPKPEPLTDEYEVKNDQALIT